MRWVVIALVLASCERPSVHDRECAVVRELAKLPHRYENDVFAQLKPITWKDPELHALVAYATTEDSPGAEPPYVWDATAMARLRTTCALP